MEGDAFVAEEVMRLWQGDAFVAGDAFAALTIVFCFSSWKPDD